MRKNLRLPNIEVLKRTMKKMQTERSLRHELKILQERNEMLKQQLEEVTQQLQEERKYYMEQIYAWAH